MTPSSGQGSRACADEDRQGSLLLSRAHAPQYPTHPCPTGSTESSSSSPASGLRKQFSSFSLTGPSDAPNGAEAPIESGQRIRMDGSPSLQMPLGDFLVCGAFWAAAALERRPPVPFLQRLRSCAKSPSARARETRVRASKVSSRLTPSRQPLTISKSTRSPYQCSIQPTKASDWV